ncbi:hypothetical protein EME01_44260 [Sinorhizobium meliloti]|nr:hypothetical protein EME01_44260 [Sinorhizobium meliloti]
MPRNLGEQNSESIVTAVEISPPTPKPTIARAKQSMVKFGAIAQAAEPMVNSRRLIVSMTRRP